MQSQIALDLLDLGARFIRAQDHAHARALESFAGDRRGRHEGGLRVAEDAVDIREHDELR